MDLTVEVGDHGKWSVVTVAGEVDIATGPQLEMGVDQAFERGGPVAVDVRGVSFMDSSGLRAILNARERLVASGRGFAVVSDGGPVRRLFDITGVEGSLTIVEGLEELPSDW